MQARRPRRDASALAESAHREGRNRCRAWPCPRRSHSARWSLGPARGWRSPSARAPRFGAGLPAPRAPWLRHHFSRSRRFPAGGSSCVGRTISCAASRDRRSRRPSPRLVVCDAESASPMSGKLPNESFRHVQELQQDASTLNSSVSAGFLRSFEVRPDVLRGARKNKWCPGAESNHRHCDFQSHALPTELPGQAPGHARESRVRGLERAPMAKRRGVGKRVQFSLTMSSGSAGGPGTA